MFTAYRTVARNQYQCHNRVFILHIDAAGIDYGAIQRSRPCWCLRHAVFFNTLIILLISFINKNLTRIIKTGSNRKDRNLTGKAFTCFNNYIICVTGQCKASVQWLISAWHFPCFSLSPAWRNTSLNSFHIPVSFSPSPESQIFRQSWASHPNDMSFCSRNDPAALIQRGWMTF